MDILQVLQQKQLQQMQQQQQMQILMQQLQLSGPRPRPVQGEAVPPPSLPATEPARPPLQHGEPPWVAPSVPRAPNVCRQCEQQEAHIFLHSYSPPDRSSCSIGSCRHLEGPDLTWAAPRLPPAASRQSCHVGRWVYESDAGRQELMDQKLQERRSMRRAAVRAKSSSPQEQ